MAEGAHGSFLNNGSDAQLVLLGGFSFIAPTGQACGFPTRRSERLLAMIARAGAGGANRETLCEQLYPEGDPCRARGALATELWRLRRTLCGGGADHWIVANGDRLLLAEEHRVKIDAIAFLRAAETARSASASGPTRLVAAAEAVGLYRGEFMAGNNDEWCVRERTLMHARWLDCVEVLLQSAQVRGDAAEILHFAAILIAAEPFLESAYRAMMMVYLARGDRGAALKTYRRLERCLLAELGVPPSPETTHMIKDLTVAQPTPSTTADALGSGQDVLRTAPAVLRRIAAALDKAP